MSSTNVDGNGKPHTSLSTVPPEVATDIFSQLPSLADVLALSRTSHRLQDVWLQNVNPVYNNVAPKSIACESAARRFLVDQGGPDLVHSMTAKDVVRILRNANVVEGAIRQFEQEIVSRVRSTCVAHLHMVKRGTLTSDDPSR